MIAYLSTELQSQPQSTPNVAKVLVSSVLVTAHFTGNMPFFLCSLSIIIPSHSWVLDTSDTHHVCSFLPMFTHLKPIHIVHASLPTCVTIAVTHVGLVCFSSLLTLHNVCIFLHSSSI